VRSDESEAATAEGVRSPSSGRLDSVRDYYAKQALSSLTAGARLDLDGSVCTPLGCGDSIGLAALKPGEVVLDLGSGAGLDVLRSAGRVGSKGFVYGLEMTDEMLAVAHRSAEAHGVDNVTFLKGRIEDVPLPDGSVDVIVSNCVINLSVDKDRALREAYRVLRPGGRLAVVDVVVDGGLGGLVLSERRIRSFLDWTWTRCIAGALTVEDYRNKVGDAGFTDVEVVLTQRYTVEAALARAGSPVARLSRIAGRLSPPAIRSIVDRFASAAITARRSAPSIARRR